MTSIQSGWLVVFTTGDTLMENFNWGTFGLVMLAMGWLGFVMPTVAHGVIWVLFIGAVASMFAWGDK